jgi:hypothetical protein
MADGQFEMPPVEAESRRGRTERNQFGLATMMAALALAALWFGWAEVVGDVLGNEAASRKRPIEQPAFVFQSP